jgi:hypothetical protein
MTLERVKILTPQILEEEVFLRDQFVKLLRPLGRTDIFVANDETQHLWMLSTAGLAIGAEVASAATIFFADTTTFALAYEAGGGSLKTTKPKFVFKENKEQRLITFNLLEAMLIVFGKSGVQFVNLG